MPSAVAVPIDEYRALAALWMMIADLQGGTAAMRDAARVYLPQEPAEGDDEYIKRLSRSVLTALYTKIADRIVGKPLKDPIVVENLPPRIEEMLNNIDLQGSDLNVFARNVLSRAVDDGVTHVLVDFPQTTSIRGDHPDGRMTIAQERAAGIRPYAVHIPAGDLIGWKYETDISGRRKLTQIRYREFVKVQDPEDEFSQIQQTRIRVLDDDGRVRVYVPAEGDEDDWVILEEFQRTQTGIPLVTLYTRRTGFMSGIPLLLDVGYLNIAHWQSDSDQRNIVHVSRVPILLATGFGDGAGKPGQAPAPEFSLEVGAGSFTKAPKGADMKYVELQGHSIEAGSSDLKNLEERMETIGADLLIKRPSGDVTATGRIIDTAEGESELGLIARELESFLEDMLKLFGFWMGTPAEEATVSVFKDFGVALGAGDDMKLLQTDRANGDISRETYWAEQQRRGVLADTFDAEAESVRIEEEAAASMEGEEDEEGGGGTNSPGDTTAEADGHAHTLEEGGFTDTVNGHRHQWQPEATMTSVQNDHDHDLPARRDRAAA